MKILAQKYAKGKIISQETHEKMPKMLSDHKRAKENTTSALVLSQWRRTSKPVA